MTKRNGNFTDPNRKRSKADDGVSDLWSDDSNFEDLEECLVLATQVCEANKSTNAQQNISILPDYHIFKVNETNMYTSTQASYNGNIASTSIQPINGCRNNNIINKSKQQANVLIELETQVKHLKEKCEDKDGEISILRVQLKEVKCNFEQEYQKKEKDWISKINTCNKENLAIKGQLDFKNLEIVNLKNRLLEICRTHSIENLLESDYKEKNDKASIFVNSEQKYKLVEAFDMNELLHFPMQSRYITMDSNFKKVANTCMDHGGDFHNYNDSYILDGMFAEKKMQCTNNYIDEIVTISMSSLCLLYNNLLIQEYYVQNTDNLCDGMNLETLKEYEDLNLMLETRIWYNKDTQEKAKWAIHCITNIFPYNYYLQKRLLSNALCLQIHVNYLSYIKMIIKIINRTRKAETTQEFLCTVVKLLLSISQTEAFNKYLLYVLDIIKELILTKPSAIVLKNLLLFLKQAGIYRIFTMQLCDTPRLNLGVSRSCIFEPLVALYKRNVFEQEGFNIAVILNTLQFLSNLSNYNPVWLHYIENRCCSCIYEFNTLVVTLIYELLMNYKKARIMNVPDSINFRRVLKNCVKMLYVITFKYLDTINKYNVDSQYKFIISYLYLSKDELGMDEFETEALEDMGMQNNICKINSIYFDKIVIWS